MRREGSGMGRSVWTHWICRVRGERPYPGACRMCHVRHAGKVRAEGSTLGIIPYIITLGMLPFWSRAEAPGSPWEHEPLGGRWKRGARERILGMIRKAGARPGESYFPEAKET